MPRRYYRRRTVAVRPKKKWASNILVWNYQAVAGPTYSVVLVANKAQENAPTPTIIKTGNFKITADVNFQIAQAAANANPCCIAYIVYVPEGWPTASDQNFDDLITKHPEWIMGTKIMGGNFSATAVTGFGVETLNLSTRLKRNLNSGDQVQLVLKLNFGAAQISSVYITGNCRYWTCAN